MKREIKFRGKGVSDGEWVYGYLIHTDGIDENGNEYVRDVIRTIQQNFGPIFRVVDPDTVSQFTGIKDRHGVEIYEGDIIRGEYTTYDGTHELLYRVYWADNGGQRYIGFGFSPINEAAENLDSPKVDWVQGEMEIISNIYNK